MHNLPSPHGDKLIALLDNKKLPDTDKESVNDVMPNRNLD